MTTVIYSVACRGDEKRNIPGHGGRYGTPNQPCPKCKRPMHVTGAMTMIDLKEPRDV